MKAKILFPNLTLPTLILVLAPTALASSIWFVDGVHGNDHNNCTTPVTACKTIGHAISLASSGDFIVVAPATYPENLTISFSLNVMGANATTTIVDGGGVNTVIRISAGNVNLSKLTIRNGRAKAGGGVNNSGTLMISYSTLSGNSAAGDTGFLPGGGGGVYNQSILTINNSTISGNVASAGETCYSAYGGGIRNHGTLTVNNSTVSGNTVSGGDFDFCGSPHGYGGGISHNGRGLTINNSTISGNVANGRYGGFGGGISGSVTLQNSIVANSASGGNCYGTMTSHGYNLSSDNTCNFDQMGDLNNTNPLLGPLQNNGGPTQTQALLDGSPAIDSGNPSGCTDSNGHLLTTDQRGMPRPDHEDLGGCDMGAYERQMD